MAKKIEHPKSHPEDVVWLGLLYGLHKTIWRDGTHYLFTAPVELKQTDPKYAVPVRLGHAEDFLELMTTTQPPAVEMGSATSAKAMLRVPQFAQTRPPLDWRQKIDAAIAVGRLKLSSRPTAAPAKVQAAEIAARAKAEAEAGRLAAIRSKVEDGSLAFDAVKAMGDVGLVPESFVEELRPKTPMDGQAAGFVRGNSSDTNRQIALVEDLELLKRIRYAEENRPGKDGGRRTVLRFLDKHIADVAERTAAVNTPNDSGVDAIDP